MSSPVVAVEEPLTLPTYAVGRPEPLPLFFEKRVYQGSSGKVYPVPFVDKVYDEARPVEYRSVRLENEHVRLVLLPEIGGRIFAAADKNNADYDFFYRQDVIKPALVGLAGPWISGGVEFNWPQHHRPGTFLPVDVQIEREPGGAVTVWMSDHDPMARMKGMHGIRLRPDSAVIELRGRLYNRTPFVQTFLWWANAAARVHDGYQSFFPPDVDYVADHAVRAMSSFPVAENEYYGVNYAARPGANDLSWYKNIPVPTSYMVCETDYDFFGGYDHEAGGGFLHVADRGIAPGKKQWTWGNDAFGRAWDRELTDRGGPYVELMAGVYTDNQPDFTYLAPGEVKTFRQFWWPYAGLGPVQQADRRFALRMAAAEAGDGRLDLGVAASEPAPDLRIRLWRNDALRLDESVDLAPGQNWRNESVEAGENDLRAYRLEVCDAAGRPLLAYRPPAPRTERARELAREPELPEAVESADDLYRIGEHLRQYRHPTRAPEPYWEEGLRRDPGDARCHLALGESRLERGALAEARTHLRRAVRSLTRYHPNPETGKAHYLLGLTHRFAGSDAEADASFAKAAWDDAWRRPAGLERAALALRAGDPGSGLEHAEAALEADPRCNRARVYAAHARRKLGRNDEARESLDQLLREDPLDYLAWRERGFHETALDPPAFLRRFRNDAQVALDLAFDYAEIGAYETAAEILEWHHAAETPPLPVPNPTERSPLTHYALAWLDHRLGRQAAAEKVLAEARSGDFAYCFPSRPWEQAVLEWALEQGADGLAAYALGNLHYDRRRHESAIALWERARRESPEAAPVHRNLGIAYWNVRGDREAARDAYREAIRLDPGNARLVAEYAQLREKLGDPVDERLAFLEEREALVCSRDDACVEWARLLNANGRPDAALDLLENRRFHPWEGGEGKVLRAYTEACLRLGRRAFDAGDPASALDDFEKAMTIPENLGETYHPHQAKADVNYWKGRALRQLGREDAARACFESAAAEAGDFQGMAVTSHSELSWYRGLALRELGRPDEARSLFESLRDYAREEQSKPAKIDYFATSLPNLLVFEEDLEEAKNSRAERLLALAKRGLGLGSG